MKAKKVIRTKKFSEEQTKRMCENLRSKYKTYTNIEYRFSYFTYPAFKPETINFYLYIENIDSLYNLTWSELQDNYFELMKGSSQNA